MTSKSRPSKVVKEGWTKFFITTFAGVLVLAISWFHAFETSQDNKYFSGFLVGLLVGQVSICVFDLADPNRSSKSLRWVKMLLLPLALLLALIPRSPALLYGFLSGLSVTFCFGSATAELTKGLARQSKNKSET